MPASLRLNFEIYIVIYPRSLDKAFQKGCAGGVIDLIDCCVVLGLGEVGNFLLPFGLCSLPFIMQRCPTQGFFFSSGLSISVLFSPTYY